MTIKSGDALRAEIQGLGLSMMGLARVMRAFGDTREANTIWRSIQRMASGENKVSGEMQVIMRLLANVPAEQLKAIAENPEWENEAAKPETDIKRRRWKLDLGFLKVSFEAIHEDGETEHA